MRYIGEPWVVLHGQGRLGGCLQPAVGIFGKLNLNSAGGIEQRQSRGHLNIETREPMTGSVLTRLPVGELAGRWTLRRIRRTFVSDRRVWTAVTR